MHASRKNSAGLVKTLAGDVNIQRAEGYYVRRWSRKGHAQQAAMLHEDSCNGKCCRAATS